MGGGGGGGGRERELAGLEIEDRTGGIKERNMMHNTLAAHA